MIHLRYCAEEEPKGAGVLDMLVCCKPVLRYSWFAIGTVM